MGPDRQALRGVLRPLACRCHYPTAAVPASPRSRRPLTATYWESLDRLLARKWIVISVKLAAYALDVNLMNARRLKPDEAGGR